MQVTNGCNVFMTWPLSLLSRVTVTVMTLSHCHTPGGLWCRDPPVAPDHGHVVHAALVAVCELLEADLRLSVHRVLALSRHTGLSI